MVLGRVRWGAVARLTLYHAVVRWLPPSTAPGGGIWRAARRVLVAPVLAGAGRDVNIEHGAFFGRGDAIRLGNRSGIGIDCRLHGPVSIGDDVMMGPDVLVYAQAHEFGALDRPMMDQGYREPRAVVIEDDVWIGARVIILPGVRVGRGSVLGAGAVVTRDVPPYSVAAGNPARVMKDRRSQHDDVR